jgi:hypothetical protein
VAGPPAPIARSYKPKGRLHLYRLAETARFHCVRCREDKTANLVAIIAGSWTQTVCNDCYGLLVSGEAKQRKKSERSRRERRPGPAKQAAKKQKEKRPRGPKAPQAIGQKERQQLERRLPGIDRLLSFFRAADVPIELVRGGRLWINRHQTSALTWILPARERLDWNNVIDEMALEYAGDRFAHAVAENARFGEGLRAFLRRRENAFEVMRDEVRLAMIHATQARVPHRDPIEANFLTAGPHWQRLADVVHAAESELVAEWEREQEAKEAAAKAAAVLAAAEAAAAAERARAAARRRLDEFPDGLPFELEEACLEASSKIRNKRQVAYENPVVLESEYGELTLLPITGPEERLLVPFQLGDGVDELVGELLLADHDPLPLLIRPEVDDDEALAAWTCALLGFADATCIEIEPAPPAPPRRLSRPRWGAATPRSRGGGASRAVPRRRPWPEHLEPVGRWVRYSGAFVAGHRRRLNEGQNASAEARARARQVGIVLGPGETWVRPHTRGIPDGLEMRFRWTAPAPLGLSYG